MMTCIRARRAAALQCWLHAAGQAPQNLEILDPSQCLTSVVAALPSLPPPLHFPLVFLIFWGLAARASPSRWSVREPVADLRPRKSPGRRRVCQPASLVACLARASLMLMAWHDVLYVFLYSDGYDYERNARLQLLPQNLPFPARQRCLSGFTRAPTENRCWSLSLSLSLSRGRFHAHHRLDDSCDLPTARAECANACEARRWKGEGRWRRSGATRHRMRDVFPADVAH
ncbi:hypothetical protein BC628DRAFT_1005985 [Trametes gibbosa]|nr:hypothetical protein BC628DRAFT_1005985 [Trametes gibbosa]